MANKQQREIKYLRKIGKFYNYFLHKADKSIQYFEKVMKLEEQIYGINSKQMLKTYETMVQLHSNFGLEHNVQALSLAEQLELNKENQGLFSRVLKYKAIINFKLGDYELCMQCFQDYVENNKMNYGESSEKYFESQIDLGRMYRVLREQEQAIFTHQQCLEKLITILKNEDTQEIFNYEILKRKSAYELVIDYVEFEMHEKAGQQLNELLLETEALFGEHSYETMHLVNLKVWTMLPQKELRDQARALCEKNTMNSMKYLGNDSFLTSECYYYMSEIFSSQGNFVKAIDMANKSLKLRMKIPPDSSAWNIKGMIQCGKLEVKFGSLNRGINLLEKAQGYIQTAFGDQSYYYCQCNLYLGQGKRIQGNYEQSEQILENALIALPKTAASMYFCALLHLQLSLSLKSVRDYARCKQLCEHSIANFISNTQSTIYFETLECLSEALLHTGEKQRGIEGYEKILQTREAELQQGEQKQREEVIRLLILVATMISKQKEREEKEKAIQMLQKALNLSLKGKNEKNSEIMQIFQLISMVYDGLGDKKKSKEYRSKVDKMKKEIGQKKLK